MSDRISISYLPYPDGTFEFIVEDDETREDTTLRGSAAGVDAEFMDRVAPAYLLTKYVRYSALNERDAEIARLRERLRVAPRKLKDLSVYTFGPVYGRYYRVEDVESLIGTLGDEEVRGE